MKELTQRQAQVLEYIRRIYREKGYPPTIREIGDAMGIRSTNGVTDHLVALERKGAIRRIDAISRGIIPTGDVPESEPTKPPEPGDIIRVPFPRSPGYEVKMDPKLFGLVPSGLPSSPRATGPRSPDRS